jgi:hypothetical protein
MFFGKRKCPCRCNNNGANKGVTSFGLYPQNVGDQKATEGTVGRRTLMPSRNVTLPSPEDNARPRHPQWANRKHTLISKVARWAPNPDSDPGAGAESKSILVYSPSNRLRLAVFAAIEADVAGDPTFSTVPQWSIRAMSKNPETGVESSLQLVYPTTGTKPLPDAYELDSAMTLLRIDLNLDSSNFCSEFLPAGSGAYLTLIATWEPNVQTIPEAELELLYSQCSITAGGVLEMLNDPVICAG